MMNKPVAEQSGRTGVRWMRVSTDFPAAIHEMLRGRLSPAAYLRSFRNPVQFALMAADDPLAGLLDLPLFVYKNLCNQCKDLSDGLPLKAEGLKSKSSSSPQTDSLITHNLREGLNAFAVSKGRK
jgi:predicted ATP-grasp superfamily ATP-dependent carboligase